MGEEQRVLCTRGKLGSKEAQRGKEARNVFRRKTARGRAANKTQGGRDRQIACEFKWRVIAQKKQ